ncbi:MAG TPA: hypothetical protein VGG48_05515 [Rhizomicrobium sp.]
MSDDEENRPYSDRSGATASDGAAAALALGAASRDKADRFLAEQARLAEAQAEFVRLQAEDFRDEEPVRRRILKLSHSSALMKVAFEVALALVALLIVVIVGSALWSAAHDDGLVIESFSVPPDLANRGLTGDVVAARLLDKLAQMQAQTVSNRAASSYANNWGSDIKVQIPDTGISIGQAYEYLAQWLGHETHISGEVYRDGKGGISVTARVGSDASPSFTGTDADFEKLLQQAAEAVYQRTQPYRYAVYLGNRNRNAESEAAYHTLIENGSSLDRAWAYVGLSTLDQLHGDLPQAVRDLHASLAARPGFVMAYIDLSNDESSQQHDEAALDAERKLAQFGDADQASSIDHRGLALALLQNEAGLANSLGDYTAQLAAQRRAESLPDFLNQYEVLHDADMSAYAFLHDGGGFRGVLAAMPPTRDPNTIINRSANLLTVDFLFAHWAALKSNEVTLLPVLKSFGPAAETFHDRVWAPIDAAAAAIAGDFATANREIASTPADCDLCLRMRGRIAREEHRWAASGYWYAMLSARTPSVPFADTEWGQMLLAKGDAAGAIAKFQSAHAKGPHFADPLEGWGEALMMQNHADLALAKFGEAAGYAPNWGRLHLKWGEALLYTGHKDEARRQFAIAARLDLMDSEKAELARASHG